MLLIKPLIDETKRMTLDLGGADGEGNQVLKTARLRKKGEKTLTLKVCSICSVIDGNGNARDGCEQVREKGREGVGGMMGGRAARRTIRRFL